MDERPAQGSTEDWCKKWPTEGHYWTYTHHAGTPRLETKSCRCGYVSVQPIREQLEVCRILDLATVSVHSTAEISEVLGLVRDHNDLRYARMELAELREKLTEAEFDRDRYQRDYLGACEQVAAMHAAAVGEVRGPIRGVVEDVADEVESWWGAYLQLRNEVRRIADEVLVLNIAEIQSGLREALVATAPAAQNAGRDWRGEITAVRAAHVFALGGGPFCACGWEPQNQPTGAEVWTAWYGHVNDAIVAALGLHDLEQAAADSLAALTELRRAPDPIAMERDAARREVEQLRGEVERLRLELPAMGGRQSTLWGFINELDDRLAATAPATQDSRTVRGSDCTCCTCPECVDGHA
ncbi:MAG TPA: hypothetical protein VF477_11325 [Mycobacterium sp.]